jgi:Fe-S-cluster-containing dehydrogenase component
MDPTLLEGSGRSATDADSATPRRRFVETVAGAFGAIAATGLTTLEAEAEVPAYQAQLSEHPAAYADGNYLERMRADLHRALQKPVEERRWGMVIDLEKCIGCRACTVACVAENDLPPGVLYRPVITEEVGSFPNVRLRFIPRPCMQCDNPPCVPPCPVGATFQRPDGVVAIDYEQCIGCRYCISACPYGARTFDFGEFHSDGTPYVPEYERRPNYEYGEERARTPEHRQRSPMGNARKCHFCVHRLEVGLLPACVTTCLGGATYFGDLTDETSLASELIADERVMRLKEELGTNPKVFYLT